MPLRLKKRGRYWHISGTVAGRELRRSTGTSDKTIAERIRAEAEAAEWKRHLDGPHAHVTFAQAALAYLEAEKSDRFIAPIAAHWKDTALRNITAEAVRQSAFKLYPNAKGATRNRQVIVPTQAIINHAAGLNWCSPMKVKRFPVEVKVKQIVTPGWAAAFATHASPHLGALCFLMLGTGARISQALAIQWRHIDLEKREARIPMSRKNHEEHVAHLPQQVTDALESIPSSRHPDEYVFGYVGRDSVTQPWKNAIKRAQLPYRSPHCCRHGFATLMLRAGFDVKTVAARGGWKDASVVLRTYAHAIEDRTVTDAVFRTNSAQTAAGKVLDIRNKRRKKG
ncbi:site-specific integrase [Paracoccus sp. S3-43]|uniref:tyrosine-type recombinase/integrase n=1 Tax=Paracoccus sp. S3-43 TaxID=3030011 RepID=UPI0023B0DEB6|nr:site-specific integrase [Paracoccus sp. S3-43]WEF24637.1 site-specific integrase [Paracoccus sp. S3-43]